MKPSFSFRATAGSLLATTVALHLAFVAPAKAATLTWNGGGADDLYSNAANWGGVTPTPLTQSDYVFSGTTRLTPTISGNTSYSTGNLTFASGAGSFVIGVGDAGTLNRIFLTASTANIIQNSNSDQTINAKVQIGGSGGPALVVSGSGTGNLTLNNLFFQNANSTAVFSHSATINSISGVTSSIIRLTGTQNQTVTFSGTDTGGLASLILNSTTNTYGGVTSGISSVQASNAAGFTSNASIKGNDMTFAGSNSMTFAGGLTVYGATDKTLTFSNTGGTIIQGTAQLGGGNGTSGGTGNYTRTVSFLVNSGATTTISANLTGNYSIGTTSIAKTGLGTLVLSGTSNINGTTTVSAGTLLINGDQSGATGAVDVSASASLGGNGTIGGATTIADNGILTPGTNEDTATTLTLNTKNLTLSGVDTKVNMDITGTGAGAFDTVAGINAFSLNGDLTFNLSGSYSSASWDAFDFQSKSGNFDTVTLTGSYSVSLSRVGEVWSGSGWQFDQTTGVLSIPEPSAWILATIGLTTAMIFRRRRNSVR